MKPGEGDGGTGERGSRRDGTESVTTKTAKRWIWEQCPRPAEADDLLEGNITLTGTLEVAELWGGKYVYKRLRRTLPSGKVRERWSRMKR